MPKLTPVEWRTLVRVFEAAGFTADRQRGSHIVMEKPGVARPVVIPAYPQVPTRIILANLRTAGLSRDQYFEILARL
ncbi:MAG: type II toxin-antitoxin system HicA family toxin [Candidatus Lambdaproteobacteria bacterium]|nr:type II toxin-antitoxin system HicA family toxin [Candidatus Lambdaproteobacteria bacterium]